MNKEEYEIQLKIIHSDYEIAKKKLAIDYAIEHNLYNIGDIVTDHIGKLKIEKIGFAIHLSEVPSCVYYGIRLKKDGAPIKRGEHNPAYQINLLK